MNHCVRWVDHALAHLVQCLVNLIVQVILKPRDLVVHVHAVVRAPHLPLPRRHIFQVIEFTLQ